VVCCGSLGSVAGCNDLREVTRVAKSTYDRLPSNTKACDELSVFGHQENSNMATQTIAENPSLTLHLSEPDAATTNDAQISTYQGYGNVYWYVGNAK
jgi:hypothetical protein